jgi:calcium channel MID1
MQLSPLQSRLAASIIATCLLIALYYVLFPSHFALAAELDFRIPPGPILEERGILFDGEDFDEVNRRDHTYEPEFAPFDRSIIGRAPAGVTGLANNVPEQLNVSPGQTICYVFERSSMSGRAIESEPLELRDLGKDDEEPRSVAERDIEAPHGTDLVGNAFKRRQSSVLVYVSANTCMQPSSNSSSTGAPQLTLYISTSAQNTCPGPGQDSNSQTSVPFVEGAVVYNTTTSTDFYIGISAANGSFAPNDFWNYQVAASTDAPFFNYNPQPNLDQLVWTDSDASSALLITRNLTSSDDPSVQQQLMSSQPYVMFAQPADNPSIAGLRYSNCGLEKMAVIAATKNGQSTNMVGTSMTTFGADNLPKQQFYLSGLNASSNYNGILAVNGNSTNAGSGVVGGGGLVFRSVNFTTKAGNYSFSRYFSNLLTDIRI